MDFFAYVGRNGGTDSEGSVCSFEGFCDLYNEPSSGIKNVILKVVPEILTLCSVFGRYRVRIWLLIPVILTLGVGGFWIIFVDLPKYVAILLTMGKTVIIQILEQS